MSEGNKITRRNLLRLGLGASAGLALWEFYKSVLAGKTSRQKASFAAFQDAGLDQAMLRQLLGIVLRKGGEYADVFLECSVSASLTFEDEEDIRTANGAVIIGAGLRLMDKGGVVFRVTEDLS